MRSVVQFLDIHIIKLQLHRRHVQTRMAEHLLRPPDVRSVSRTLIGNRVGSRTLALFRRLTAVKLLFALGFSLSDRYVVY